LTNGEIAKVEAIFDMRPYFHRTTIEIKKPYSETAAYNMGRTQKRLLKHFLLQVETKNSYC
jgi:hypothetical protein